MSNRSPINLSTPVQFDSPLPDAVDVAIIGAGIIGVSTALYLAERGIRVMVCEKGRVAGEQSSRNWGWIRQTGRDPAELPIVIEAIRSWKALARRTGEPALKFTQQGVLYLAENERDCQSHAEFAALAQQHGVDSRLLDSRDVAGMLTGAGRSWRGGLYTPSDGRAEPWVAVPALARAATRAGALIKENCAVRGLDFQAGSVSGVITEHGTINTGRVLLAGGAWSSLLVRQIDVLLPQLSVRATVARAENIEPFFAGNVKDGGLAYRQREDGGYNLALTDSHEHYVGPDSFRFFTSFIPGLKASWRTTTIRPAAPAHYPDAWLTAHRWRPGEITPFERNRVLDPRPARGAAEKMARRFSARYPNQARPRITHAWAGMIDAMPDFVPVMDEVPGRSGLFIATGFSGHGFGIGPAAGRIMADLIQDNAPGHDLSRFRFSRFTDGSRLVCGPAL